MKTVGKTYFIYFTQVWIGNEPVLGASIYESAEKIEGLRNGVAKIIHKKYFKLSYSFCQS